MHALEHMSVSILLGITSEVPASCSVLAWLPYNLNHSLSFPQQSITGITLYALPVQLWLLYLTYFYLPCDLCIHLYGAYLFEVPYKKNTLKTEFILDFNLPLLIFMMNWHFSRLHSCEVEITFSQNVEVTPCHLVISH